MQIVNNIFKYKNDCEVIGLTDELNNFCVLNRFNTTNKNILVVGSSLFNINNFYEKMLTLTDDVLLFPMDDFITSIAVAESPELKIKRLETLDLIKSGKKFIVVTNVMGYLKYLTDFKLSKSLNISIKKNVNINRDNFIKILDEYGYVRDSLVTTTGVYSVRGFVIDLFIINEEHPIRLEFFGDEIESIRYFDENTQLSIKEIDSIKLLPIEEINTDSKSSIYDYLDEPDVFFLDEKLVMDELDKINNDIKEYNSSNNINTKYMFDFDDIKPKFKMFLNHLENNNHEIIRYKSSSITNFNSNFDLLKDYINKKIKDNTIVFCLSRIKEVDAITSIYPTAHIVKEDDILLNKVNIVNKKINAGFEIDNVIVISEYDIEKINDRRIKYKNTLKIGKKIKSFDDLEIGDYVVHYKHGIGQYGGIKTLSKNGILKDYIVVNYLDNDKIYVPVEKIDTLFKYSAKDGSVPKINALSSTSWAKTKASLKKKIHDISKDLLDLYAKRANISGPKFIKNELEDIFATDFLYDLTPDQEKSIKDIEKDLSSSIPMDRLLCGDVGFGKTEVAFRAIARTVINGYQVAYLCPTTILSSQQYMSAVDRFKDLPINIALLNRFTTPSKVKEIINGLNDGSIDVVFGTHRLLSNDVSFKQLGLLVVDEEQRFGVTHKEKIKQYKTNVNVLTLSATPIPRTMKMAMTGLRDLSIIDTPPVNRYPVQTYVLEEQDVVIKDVIYKEMARHGQVFILYNRVESIESKLYDISRLVPEARIVYVHGQMNKNELEEKIQDFIDYKYDILLCTTIIETGIDMPNVNTLIVYDADRFGLSQLYQLRGRVGRSNRVAYAYLMYNHNKVLKELAIKRLDAIKEFTELGSGYRIAMRDLALRGAGDILGGEQSGFASEVGIDLYLRLVDDEIKRLKGEEVEEIDDITTNSLIEVDTHIEDTYVSDESIKIEIHKKINEIDSYESLMQIKDELEDRFGKISKTIEIYMYEEWFEKIASKLGIVEVVQNNHYIEVKLPADVVDKVKFDKLFVEAYNICSNFTFRSVGKSVVIRLPILNLDKHFLYYLVPFFSLVVDEVNKYNV